MKQVLEKIVASLSVLMVFCLHVYFVMLLGTKPALAQDTEQTSTVKVGMLNAETSDAPKKKDTIVKIGVVDTQGKPIVKKEIKIENIDENSEEAATAASAEDSDDKGLNIRINEKDGIVISGSEKLVERLKDLEKTIDAKVNDRAIVAAANNSIGKTLENILVPITIFLIAFGFAGYVVYAKQRTRKEYLETIRALAQNNQPIPPELLANLNASNDMGFGKNKWNNDPNSIQGVKYLFVGLGIAGFMIIVDDYSFPAALGYVFAVIGAFHIVKSNLLQKHMEANKATPAAVVPEVTTAQTPAAPTTPSNT